MYLHTHIQRNFSIALKKKGELLYCKYFRARVEYISYAFALCPVKSGYSRKTKGGSMSIECKCAIMRSL